MLIYGITAICLISCIAEKPCPPGWEDRVEGDEVIRFNALYKGGYQYDVESKAFLESTTGSLNTGFGVFAYKTGEDDFMDTGTGERVETMANAKITSQDGKNWTSSPNGYWLNGTSEKYSFFAYYPYSSNQFGKDIALSPPSTIDECRDILAAKPVLDMTTRDVVEFDFEHIFSKVSAKIILPEEYDEHKYELTAIGFNNVRSYSKYDFISREFTGDISSHSLDIGTDNISVSYDPGTNRNCIIIDPVLICAHPYQTLSEGLYVNLSFRYTYTNPDTSDQFAVMFDREVEIREDFEQNTEYALELTLDRIIEESPIDLSPDGRYANCYIVPGAGRYYFTATRGNSNELLRSASKAVVLWETFGDKTMPETGDLIRSVKYNDGIISFMASDKKGNASIALIDSGGEIIWSWHIWLTDTPGEHVYKNNAGVMMDRNLGATAEMENVYSYGLLYQWGRKDPFMNCDSGVRPNSGQAASTGQWGTPVASSATYGTMDFATRNPMTFITRNTTDEDWLYTADNELWARSKTIYDPCPAGYRIPDGGETGVWATAFGTNEVISSTRYDNNLNGLNFGSTNTRYNLTEEFEICYYPATGYIDNKTGGLTANTQISYWWSCLASDEGGDCMYILWSGKAKASLNRAKSYGASVRCQKEQ